MFAQREAQTPFASNDLWKRTTGGIRAARLAETFGRLRGTSLLYVSRDFNIGRGGPFRVALLLDNFWQADLTRASLLW